MLRGLAFCPHKGGESPQLDCVNRFTSPQHEEYLIHTHTRTRTHKERETDRERERENVNLLAQKVKSNEVQTSRSIETHQSEPLLRFESVLHRHM